MSPRTIRLIAIATVFLSLTCADSSVSDGQDPTQRALELWSSMSIEVASDSPGDAAQAALPKLIKAATACDPASGGELCTFVNDTLTRLASRGIKVVTSTEGTPSAGVGTPLLSSGGAASVAGGAYFAHRWLAKVHHAQNQAIYAKVDANGGQAVGKSFDGIAASIESLESALKTELNQALEGVRTSVDEHEKSSMEAMTRQFKALDRLLHKASTDVAGQLQVIREEFIDGFEPQTPSEIRQATVRAEYKKAQKVSEVYASMLAKLKEQGPTSLYGWGNAVRATAEKLAELAEEHWKEAYFAIQEKSMEPAGLPRRMPYIFMLVFCRRAEIDAKAILKEYKDHDVLEALAELDGIVLKEVEGVLKKAKTLHSVAVDRGPLLAQYGILHAVLSAQAQETLPVFATEGDTALTIPADDDTIAWPDHLDTIRALCAGEDLGEEAPDASYRLDRDSKLKWYAEWQGLKESDLDLNSGITVMASEVSSSLGCRGMTPNLLATDGSIDETSFDAAREALLSPYRQAVEQRAYELFGRREAIKKSVSALTIVAG